jgi:TetR/AcrR family transcriptional regulator, transcriptional repressor of bet genes
MIYNCCQLKFKASKKLNLKKDEDLRVKRGEETRRSLIQATITAVANNGLSGTTLNVVAELAGVSRALVGFHFSSKELLLDAALENALGTYDKSLKESLARVSEKPLEQISGYLYHDMNFAATHNELLSLWFAAWGEVRVTNKYRQSLLPIDHNYRDEIAGNLAKIMNDKKEAKRRAIMLDSFVYGVWLECHIDPDSYDLSENLRIADSLIQLVSKP